MIEILHDLSICIYALPEGPSALCLRILVPEPSSEGRVFRTRSLEHYRILVIRSCPRGSDYPNMEEVTGP